MCIFCVMIDLLSFVYMFDCWMVVKFVFDFELLVLMDVNG